MVVQAVSPLLRSDFAQSTAPYGDLTDSFVLQRRKSPPTKKSSWPPGRRPALGKVVHMQAQSTIEPTGRRRSMLAGLWSVICGDKYMVDAYPLEAPASLTPAASDPTER